MPDIRAEGRLCPILNKYNKCFLDDFQNRSSQKRTWFDVQVHLAVHTNYRTSHSSSTISSHTLNPHAAPFVSSNAFVLPHQLVVPQSQVPAWFSAFYAGTQITATQRDFNAFVFTIVDYRSWTNTTIAELAQHFCWRGAEGLSREARVATFAQAVHTRFSSTYGARYADEFLLRLRENVFGAFKAIWKSVYPPQASTVPYISSALSLAAFVGDLFIRGLFPVSQVHLCLSFLVEAATTIEHVHAIHLLLLHANKGAWRAHNLGQFMANFVRQIGYSEGRRRLYGMVDVSLIGREIERDEIGAWIGEIKEMVRRW